MTDNVDERQDLPPDPIGDSEPTPPPPPKDKKSKKSKKNKGGKKGKGAIIIIVVLVLLIGGAAAVLALDLFGVREDIVMPYLRNAPLIGSLIPAADEDPSTEISEEQLRREHTTQSLQIESQLQQIQELEWRLFLAEHRINQDLMRYYDNWHLFIQARAAFMQMVAHEAPQDFVAFFEQFWRLFDTAYIPQLLEEAEQLNAFDAETNEMVRTLTEMDESSAGEILERWMTTDLSLMVRVLRAMRPNVRGPILETLDAAVSANMLILISVPAPTFTPIAPQLIEFPPISPPTREEWQGLLSTPAQETTPETQDEETSADESEDESTIEETADEETETEEAADEEGETETEE